MQGGLLLGPDLSGFDTEDLRRQRVAVRRRRRALRRRHPATSTPVSVLLATNRPDFVDHAIRTVAAQRNVLVETILVTHGFELPRKRVRALRAEGLALTVRTASASLPLGAVLNIALDCASGDLVSKMDDDDWYGPHHLEDQLLSLHASDATLVGVVDEYSYLAELDVTIRHARPARREYRARRVAGPAMTMRRDDLRALGGWSPVPFQVDRMLNDVVHHTGGIIHRTHGLGYLRCRHGVGHTWVQPPERFAHNAVACSPGFHPPPELPLGSLALAHYRNVRAERLSDSLVPRSAPGEEQRRVGEKRRDVGEELRAQLAVHDPVVERQRQLSDLPHRKCAVVHPRHVPHRAEAQDR